MPLDLINRAVPIAGYTPTERIGAGGYGEVWKVDAPGGLVKAMKLIYGRMDDSRAERELKALNRIKQVRHPFLLSLERIEIVDGRLVIVTELADMSLKDRYEQCRRDGLPGIPRDELLPYLRDAADALDYMSEQFGLQHLDVKPENLLLVGNHVKVADFGLVKDLHDVSVSLVGALTPVYASPEVFDDRASAHSDQYSLAIVYQEMLTGVLPFPGRTPAQLAAQHLHSRAMLSPLPPDDRLVIGRALSKEPSQRFESCRELIETLVSPEGPQRSSGADTTVSAVPEQSNIETTTIAARMTEPRNRTRPEADEPPAADQQPARQQTEAIDEHILRDVERPDGAVASRRSPSRTGLRLPGKPSVDLPAVDISEAELGFRPTLVIGIGGTAGEILTDLRGRMHQRFGELAAVPALRLLLLDTDRKALARAMRGDDGTALSAGETIGLPLRNPVEYRADSRRFLHWLSRRWLYNVPRSLETEGIRPLGRLALVDHAVEVLGAIEKALTAVTSQDAIALSCAATELELRDRTPRVFIVADVSGGTGSGMVLDVGQMVRQVLRAMKLPDDGVCAILTYGTGTNPAAQDLQKANTMACLNELYHFDRHADVPTYPDSVGGWAKIGSPFEDIYFAHLGDDLSAEDRQDALDSLVTYLYLDATTSAGAFLDKCRNLARISEQVRTDEPMLRVLGAYSIRCDLGTAMRDETRRLCQRVVRRWSGDDDVAAAPLSQSQREAAMQTKPAEDGERHTVVVDRLDPSTSECLRVLVGNVEKLRREATTAVERTLRGDAASFVTRTLDDETVRAEKSPQVQARVVLAALNEAMALEEVTEEPLSQPAKTVLGAELDKRRKHAVTEFRDVVQRIVFEMIDNPHDRLGGARRTVALLEAELDALEEEVRQSRDVASREFDGLQHELIQGTSKAARARGGWLRRCVLGSAADEFTRRLSKAASLRIHVLVHGEVLAYLRGAKSHLKRVVDELKTMQRSLAQLEQQLAPETAAMVRTDADPDAAEHSGGGLAASIQTLLAREFPRLAVELDKEFQRSFLAEQGGLLQLIGDARRLHAVLPSALYAAAWRVLRGAIRRIDVAALLLETGDDETQPADRLRACINRADPSPLTGGGARRLLMMIPEGPSAKTLSDLVHESIQPRPGVLSDSDRALVAVSEGEPLPLSQIAARLIDGRPDLLEVAARIHTRSDVEWLCLPGTIQRMQAQSES